MKWLKAVAAASALMSCVAAWAALAALEGGDPLGGVLGLLLTWVLARAAVELTARLPSGALGGDGGGSGPGRRGGGSGGRDGDEASE